MTVDHVSIDAPHWSAPGTTEPSWRCHARSGDEGLADESASTSNSYPKADAGSGRRFGSD